MYSVSHNIQQSVQMIVGNEKYRFEDLVLPESRDCQKFARVIHGVFSSLECQELINRTEASGYETALVNIGNGRQALMTVKLFICISNTSLH